MKLAFIVLTFSAFPSAVSVADSSVPASAIQMAQEWLDTHRAEDPALANAQLGDGYVLLVVSPRHALEFLRSDMTDPMPIADPHPWGVHFPIILGDSCFSSLQLHGEDGTFYTLEPMEHSANPLDIVVRVLDRRLAKGSHRVWILQLPWETSCRTIIVEQPDGERVVIESEWFPSGEIVSDETALISMMQPIASWARQTRELWAKYYGLGESTRPAKHEVPTAAIRTAERVVNGEGVVVIDGQKELFAVTGPPTLGEPWIMFWLSPIELILYAESDELDPTSFDRDPSYMFPVVVDGQTIATASVMKHRNNCHPRAGDDGNPADSEYRSGGIGHYQPGARTEWRPSKFSELGDVAIVDASQFGRWYHVLGLDGTWVGYYYSQGADVVPQPIAELAVELKQKIRAALID